MGERHIELNATDPNTFVVFEWDAFDNKRENLQPRPFEVSSSAAIDFRYHNKVLQYLTVKQTHWYDTETNFNQPITAKLRKQNEGKKEGHKYTLYGKNRTYQLIQIADNSPI